MTSGISFEDVRGKRLLIALSGGADSVALTHLLHAQRETLGLELYAAHLHHGIRGAQADGDAAFCRSLCAELDIPYIEGRMDVPALARSQGAGLETAARNARHAFLQNAMADCGADYIALAHHLDDQAETLLMHLFRGAGADGMAGMRRMQGVLYRPLLGVRRESLREYLSSIDAHWREDQTNLVADNPRNALRLHVLPLIEQSYPRAAEAIARHASIAQADTACLDALTDRFLEDHLSSLPSGLRLETGDAAGIDEAILRRALRRLCGPDLLSAKLEALLVLAAKARGKEEISRVLYAEKTPSALYLLRKDFILPPQTALALNGESCLPGICRIRAELGAFEIDPDDPRSEVLDADALEGAVLRTRCTGDRFHPLGASGDRLLSDVLSDKKIDRPLRDVMPLIAKGNRVLWTGGAGISHDARIQTKTARRVRITYINFSEE